jgi:hypothetical protein
MSSGQAYGKDVDGRLRRPGGDGGANPDYENRSMIPSVIPGDWSTTLTS